MSRTMASVAAQAKRLHGSNSRSLNYDAIKAARAKCEEAEEKLAIACSVLRANGWPENANELVRTLRHLRVWTQKDGWFDILEAQK